MTMANIKTEKQKKLIMLISENLGKAKPLTMTEMMLQAGYSPTSADQQTATLFGIKDDVKNIVDKLEEEREKALQELGKKREGAKYKDLVHSIDVMTKNAQLLGGHATERVDVYNWSDYGDDNDLPAETMEQEPPREQSEMESSGGS